MQFTKADLKAIKILFFLEIIIKQQKLENEPSKYHIEAKVAIVKETNF